MDHKKPTLRILHNLPRSGGTLFSRCLGSMENIVLLSEIHPLTLHLFNPIAQARQWFGLFSQKEIDALSNTQLTFVEAITRIHKKCQAHNKTLVIRDWSHVDFFGRPFTPIPPYQPMLVRALEKHFDLIRITLIRHPVDTWLSINNLKLIRDQLTIEQFLEGYWRYLDCFKNLDRIRFEDFCNSPDQELSKACASLQTNFDPGYRKKWYNYAFTSGDNSNIKKNIKKIQPLERLLDPTSTLQAFVDNRHYQKSLELTGYKHA